MTTGILIVAHKPLGSAFFKVLKGILGQVNDVEIVDIESDDPEDKKQDQLRCAWNSLKTERKIAIVDVEGATPYNAFTRFSKNRFIFIVSPLSLPVLLKMICYRELPERELKEKIKEIQIKFIEET